MNKAFPLFCFFLFASITFITCQEKLLDDKIMSEYKHKIITKLKETRTKRSGEKMIKHYKSEYKKWVISNVEQCPSNFLTFRAVQDLDDPSNFFCDKYVTKISDLPNQNSVQTPWSAFYWPIKGGGLSLRYSNFNQTKHSTWKEYVNSYYQPEDHNKYYDTDQWDYIVNKMYSPSEKYDLLVGDYDYTLTNKMKDEGNHMQKDENGDVPEWMGKCHGWTPASINEPRPIHTVNITAADGKTVISFYPEDIKALATVFWAEAKFETKFLGDRCNYADFSQIPSDKETGLWDDYSCFTVNPATLVTVLANQIGVKKKSLIYDPDSTGEIWNQPIFGYSISYFHPITKNTGELKDSKLDYSQLNDSDKFISFLKRKAGPQAKQVVGVHMTVNFVFENPPVFGEKQIPDNIDKRIYELYLELDESDNIVGGEWKLNKHPIFIWNPAENAKINGEGDDLVTSFNGSVEELKQLTQHAKKVSSKNTVLKAIYKYFISKSSANSNVLSLIE